MWKAVVGHDVSVKVEAQSDDWDTDPDFVNDISEKEQRWGAKSIVGSGRAEHIDIHQLRSKVSEEHEVIKKKELESGPKASYGYGGKFGTERDRMDKCAVGHEYVADVGKHSSQTDAAQGFGGKYGVQRDRADKSALGFEYKGEVEKHSSQKDYSKGFGGHYGVERDKVDKVAVGFDYRSQVEKHDSQKAASSGASSLRSRFENMAKLADEESRRKVEEERARRQARDGQVARQKWQRGSLRELSGSPRCEESSPGEEDGGDDYEEIIPKEPSQSQPCQGGMNGDYEVESPGICAVALYDYQGDGDDEISFDPDDTITHIEMVDEGWWRGQCHGKVGLFPANYVKLLH
ncbi:hypothetical protein ASZ78_007856 [Callipepla squamata]|uniref:Hematopoietic lineage cell-specific protein n=1 Tax=Callipepla squamata TaxID=9009 RepID=A0A226MJ82_CALSU|nr:hypothetical protein ASZ78_007856 [Callipepla squamata]